MSFAFKPRPDDRPATAAQGEADRSSTASETLSPVEQPLHSELFTSRPATVWPYAAPDKSFDPDAWKAESQASRPPSYSDHVSFNRGAAAFTQMKDLEALHASGRRPKASTCGTSEVGLIGVSSMQGSFGGPPLAMSAYPANFPSARLLHHRVASASSALSGDDRFMLPSDPGSDFSSDYSDTFQSSFAVPHALPFEPQYESPVRPGRANVSPAALPDYVVEEIRRLKLENMALRRMASEVVRISAGSGSLDGQTDSDRTTPVCSQHPPLTSALVCRASCKVPTRCRSIAALRIQRLRKFSPTGSSDPARLRRCGHLIAAPSKEPEPAPASSRLSPDLSPLITVGPLPEQVQRYLGCEKMRECTTVLRQRCPRIRGRKLSPRALLQAHRALLHVRRPGWRTLPLVDWWR